MGRAVLTMPLATATASAGDFCRKLPPLADTVITAIAAGRQTAEGVRKPLRPGRAFHIREKILNPQTSHGSMASWTGVHRLLHASIRSYCLDLLLLIIRCHRAPEIQGALPLTRYHGHEGEQWSGFPRDVRRSSFSKSRWSQQASDSVLRVRGAPLPHQRFGR